jgi:SAM-dependent methyltransferase
VEATLMDFSRRWQGIEQMDDAGAGGWELERALEELGWINRLLGGHRTALKALARVAPAQKEWTLLDIGTGGGDIPLAAVEWARRRGQYLRVVAVDFNPQVCAWAAKRLAHCPQIHLVQADVGDLPFGPEAFDVVHCGMFLHHFPQKRAADLLGRLFGFCRHALVVNDLHRHPMAYYFTRLFLCWWARSPMVRHDAPLSVLRGFRRDELLQLGVDSGIGEVKVLWQWAFRYMVYALKRQK